MIFSNNKCCVCSRDIEIYLSAVFFCLAAALPHHNINLIKHLILYRDILGEGIKIIYIYIDFNNLWMEYFSSKQEFTKTYEEHEIIIYKHRQKRNKLKKRRRYVLEI